MNVVGLSNHVSTGWSYDPTVALEARECLSRRTATQNTTGPLYLLSSLAFTDTVACTCRHAASRRGHGRFQEVVRTEARQNVRQAAQATASRHISDIDSSDADAEVLADYVIALVTANETEGSIRKNCIESLSDFLQDSKCRMLHGVLGQ